MASEVPRLSENVNFSDDPKARKSLRSAVITETDPLKIKLKISKKDAAEPAKCKREGSAEMKMNRSQRNSGLVKFDDGRMQEKSEQECKGNVDETKMKLRSKREADDDFEQKREDSSEGTDENREKVNRLTDENTRESNDFMDRPLKKRGRPSKAHTEESERLEEKRRSKKLEMENDIEKNMGEVKSVKESFCWTCHKDGSVVKCDTCPRVFHLKCVSLSKDPSKDWICPECSLVLHAEKMSTRSEAMKNLSLDQLCTLLNFAIGRMKNVPESQAFWKPVDPKEVPFYDKYITNPMDLNLLEKNMKAKMYGSPQAFLADAKWLLHNSIIFNSTQSPLTSTARFLVKICRQEMAEIENCPDCYLNAHTKREWFVEVCRKPHILIWARLKGFPFWPAKAMSTNFKNQSVDARFFGAHDKAWVPIKECYLYSRNSPQAISKKRTDLDDAFAEAEAYIKKIKQKYGTFCYAPDRTPFAPEMYDKQLQSMIPTFQEEKTPKKKKRRQVPEENEVTENTAHQGKKLNEQLNQNRFKLNHSNSVDPSKIPEAICFMSDDVSDEKVLSEDRISPEDEVARSLEMYDTGARVHGDAVDENSTDMEEDSSVRIPEHGYSRSIDSEPEAGNTSNNESIDGLQVTGESSNVLEKEVLCESNSKELMSTDNETLRGDGIVEEAPKFTAEEGPVTTLSRRTQGRTEESEVGHCVVSSTCSDISGERENLDNGPQVHAEAICSNKAKRKSTDEVKEEPPKKVQVQGVPEQKESSKKGEDRSVKSFTNLTLDKKQKILTEAKLLANIDEMTTVAKQKVLNELGLDASSVDVRQLAQENRKILETLNKNGHNEDNNFEDMPIKREDFEQYLMEECNQDSEVTEPDKEDTPSPRLGSIKVRDIQTLSNTHSTPHSSNNSSENILNVKEVESKKDLKSNKKIQKKKTEDDCNAKKLKLQPVIELIKLDVHDKSLQKLNRKLGLSDEVSLIMVDSEKKTCSDSTKASVSKLSIKRPERQPRARKSMPNRTRQKENSLSDSALPSKSSSSASINVISVDTENVNVQKNLLKSLCADDRKSQDDGTLNKTNKRTVLITTSEEGIRNVDVTVEEEEEGGGGGGGGGQKCPFRGYCRKLPREGSSRRCSSLASAEKLGGPREFTFNFNQ
ncbi:UNVERIFIED_CONTAM: hypothetical protein PYX00_002572 [Menopon gallinae]|uniref:Protein kinase C-binding protein 1 n=1 Tax=Menopon gallinae TaxID=328185 RepID=A0AAW2IJD6_9NEOP